jgi:thiamine-phosphate pyrophosphorylase
MYISHLHYLVTDSWQADMACVRGISWIQLRVKNLPYPQWKELALATQQVCRRYNATFIINDNPTLALELGADGVHLGKQDMPPAEARALLGPGFIVGGTANTFADIEALVAAGVDYIGLGPFRFTTTKENLSPILGLEGYQQILAQCRAAGVTVPIVGIGGIGLDDLEPLVDAGLYGVAVSGGITAARSPAKAVYDFKDGMYKALRGNYLHL